MKVLRFGALAALCGFVLAIPLVFGTFAGADTELVNLDLARNTPLPCGDWAGPRATHS